MTRTEHTAKSASTPNPGRPATRRGWGRGADRRAALATALAPLLVLSALFAAPAAALPGACPANEAIRAEQHATALPDCRAYEMVTPTYKEGQLAAGVFAISEDGARIIDSSFGAFAGAEEDVLGNSPVFGAAYQLSRNESSGWRASAIGPPASVYRSNGLFDASADLSATLWELGRRSPPASAQEAQPEGVTSFYIERSPHAFAEVGPPTPGTGVNLNRYTYLGGSYDLSHILFSTSPGFHWPFDQTAAESSPLYEYVGTGNEEPELVGVSGAKGSEELLSKCGTRLGSGEGNSMYDAISVAGSRVFFTAVGEDDQQCLGGGPSVQPPIDELFAREEELPSGELQTVPISELSASYCSEAPSPPCADANFEGASLDGSKVFFTTEQELLPGAKGRNLYEYDFNAPAEERIRCVSVPLSGEAQVQGVARISQDGSHVYFVAKGLLAGTNNEGYSPVAGEDNLYLVAKGRTLFVATLLPEDERDWTRADNRPVLSSREGRYLVFTSQADIAHESVAPGTPQVYQYDAGTHLLVRASIGQEGYNNDGRTPLYGSTIIGGLGYRYYGNDSPTQGTALLAPEDGAVFFQSPDPLTPQALNGQPSESGEPEPNIYEYRSGSVYLLSDGRDTSAVKGGGPAVYLIGSSASGGDAFFVGSDSLVGQDTNSQQDVYDARVEGGFPGPVVPASCSGDACQGAPSPPAPAPFPASAGSGPPNPAPKRHHRKKHSKNKHVRHANTNHRASR